MERYIVEENHGRLKNRKARIKEKEEKIRELEVEMTKLDDEIKRRSEILREKEKVIIIYASYLFVSATIVSNPEKVSVQVHHFINSGSEVMN